MNELSSNNLTLFDTFNTDDNFIYCSYRSDKLGKHIEMDIDFYHQLETAEEIAEFVNDYNQEIITLEKNIVLKNKIS